MLVLRGLIALFGIGGATVASIVTAVISKNPFASDALMYFVLGLLGIQLIGSLALIAAAAWAPIHRWLGVEAHRV